MARNAIIWTTNLGYMPGTNAILNSMEQHNFECDKYIIYIGNHKEELGEDYLKQWSDVKWIDVDRSIATNKSNYWYCIYGDIRYVLDNLKDSYDCILLWSADCLILNNFEDYFKIAVNLDKLILGWNEHSVADLNKLPKVWPYTHTWSVPYTDIPCFIPKTKMNFLEKLWEYQMKEGCVLNRMDAMNYAVRDLEYDVFAVTGNQWVNNLPWVNDLYKYENQLYLNGAKMYSHHRRYWSKDYIKSYFRDHQDKLHIPKIINQLYQYYNKECRVKWDKFLEKYE